MTTKRPQDYIGERTQARMRATRWWAFARALDQILYAGGVQHRESRGGSGDYLHRSSKPDDPDYARVFVVGARQYVSGIPKDVKVLGREDDYFDVEKLLREIMHECECLAVREVT